MAVQILPTPLFRGEDNNGKALAGGLLYTYAAGTTTPQATYTDSTGATPNTNPVVLNSRGEAQVWLTLGQSYKLLLKDSHGNTVPGWPIDQIQGAGNFSFALQSILTNTTLPTQGAGFIGANTSLAYPAGSVGFELNIRMPVFATIALLRGRVKTLQPSQVFVTGYYAAGDGGGGPYRYDATDTTTADNGGTVIVASDGGRWKLALQTESVSLEQFGAKGDGSTDDTVPLRNALATGLNVGGRFPRLYRVTSSVTMTVAGQTMDLSGGTIKPAGTFDAIVLGASILTLRNLTIDAAGLNGFCVSAPLAVQQIVMEDVTLQNGTSGLQLLDCFTSWFTRVKILSFSATPLLIKATIPGTATNSMWFTSCSFNANTTATDVVRVEGGVGIFFDSCNWQANQFSACNELRITTNSNAGSAAVVVKNSYFEAFGTTGNAIYVGDPSSGANVCGGVKIENNYFQTPKRPVNIGTLVGADIEITSNTFQFVTGLTGFAVVGPAGFVPNCYDNTGSLGDVDRTFVPQLNFGGATTGITYAASGQQGHYTRIGSRVTGESFIQLTSVGSATGVATIHGLPVNAGGNVNFAHATIYNNMATLPGPIFGGVLNGTSIIQLYTNSATANVALGNANFTSTTSMFAIFEYDL